MDIKSHIYENKIIVTQHINTKTLYIYSGTLVKLQKSIIANKIKSNKTRFIVRIFIYSF